MKRLFVMRHAKSSWKQPQLSDFERPLNGRGERDAPRMGAHIAERAPRIDRIVTSSAVRARATAELVAGALGSKAPPIEERASLYLASPKTLIEEIQGFDEDWSCVLLLGHNPGVTELVEKLAREAVGELPTAAVAELELALERWDELRPGVARLVGIAAPKLLEE